MQAVNELWGWLAGLDPTFAFLLALPFAIGALGLAGLALERRRAAGPRRAAARPAAAKRAAARHAHVQ
jgi:hypothetical protein